MISETLVEGSIQDAHETYSGINGKLVTGETKNRMVIERNDYKLCSLQIREMVEDSSGRATLQADMRKWSGYL